MTLNCPLTIIQTENGFILRPLKSTTEIQDDTRMSVVFATLTEVFAYLQKHFIKSLCPKCGKVARRSYGLGYDLGLELMRCESCLLIAAEGTDEEWIAFSPFSEEPEVVVKLKEQARRVYEAQQV